MRSATLIALAISICTLPAMAEDNSPRISVVGTATTEIAPNIIRWQIRIQTEGKALDKVAKQHHKTTGLLLDFLDDMDVPEEKIRTTRMTLDDNWTHSKLSSGMVRDGYKASSQLILTISNFEKYLPLWTGLSQIEGIRISNVRFDHANRMKIREETRLKALLVAKKKAQAMAKTLGSTIGQPLLIQENPQYGHNMLQTTSMRASADHNGGSNVNLAVGKIEIKEQVTTVFELLNNK